MEIEIQCVDHEALNFLEEELADQPGVSLREANVYAPELRSDLVHTLIVGVSSTGITSAASAVLIQFMRTRRAKITIRRTKAGTTVTYDGPVKDSQKVLDIVGEVPAQSLSE
ncbi:MULTISPECIES: effector-associated constant component EACC1 [unclassified Streptomyces]|uniref:effector-associated constant component EACC1 n=1 Tax=unclassified Streptomyces TaxID=2593676 RepID=UPI003D756C6D